MSLSIIDRIEQMLHRAARMVSKFGYPASWETLEIDDNHSLWASYTPNYVPSLPLTESITADVVIVGGGYTGISAAYHLNQRFPDLKIVLLEAKTLANGASGRNGGMMLNWVYGVGEMSDEMTLKVYEATRETIDRMEAIIEGHQLDVSYRRDGCFELFTDPQRAAEAKAEAKHLQSIGIPIEFLDSKQIQTYIGMSGVYGGLLDRTEGQINGVQYIRGLRPILEAGGVHIFEGSPVTQITEGETIEILTEQGGVQAKALVLAAGGYTGKLGYFRRAFFPLHSHVFATDRLKRETLQRLGWFASAGYSDDLNRISYSTITKEGNLVFGGGSNRSYDYLFNNKTAYTGSAEAGFEDMHQTLDRYLPGSGELERKYEWTGTLAITLQRNCLIGVRGDHKNIYYGLGYSGHGVVAANLAGRIISDLYAGTAERWLDMPFVQADHAPIPLEPFRWIGYQLLTRLTGKSPRAPHR